MESSDSFYLLNKLVVYDINNAPIIQLDRMSDFESESCGFESYWGRHLFEWPLLIQII